MEVKSRDAIADLLGHVVPELKEQADAAADLDLYDFLKDVFTDGFLIERLCSVEADGTDGDVVKRCFRFVEILLASPDTSIGAAAVFQVIEPLFADERLLVASFPEMGQEALAVAVATLDPDRLSSDARQALQPYLGKPAQ
ncbi:hypothetical protein ACFVEN_25865 [Streptomyces sp. NPDC057681]|uniref:hypothetical protein n=1 Tax=Streptomyces sp. NPDC057681 TaxID=3346209 RepID=UPI0036C9058A